MARTYNNISISNSNVGVVNTENLARIDAAITIRRGGKTTRGVDIPSGRALTL